MEKGQRKMREVGAGLILAVIGTFGTLYMGKDFYWIWIALVLLSGLTFGLREWDKVRGHRDE